jgi:hypothetical protein
VSLKELFVDRDVLDGDETLTRLVFGDSVYEKRRVSVVDAVEEGWEVDRHL